MIDRAAISCSPVISFYDTSHSGTLNGMIGVTTKFTRLLNTPIVSCRASAESVSTMATPLFDPTQL